MQSNLAGNQLVDRIIGALTFRTGVYDDVEADTAFTQTAWIIVAIVGFLNQLGAHRNIIGAIIGTIFAVIGFYALCLIVGWVGREVFKATVTTDELVRTLGLAYVWQVVGFLGLFLGVLGFIAAILGFAASLIATKAALDLEWIQTVITVVIGFIVFVVIVAIGGVILGILGFTAAVATGLF